MEDGAEQVADGWRPIIHRAGGHGSDEERTAAACSVAITNCPSNLCCAARAPFRPIENASIIRGVTDAIILIPDVDEILMRASWVSLIIGSASALVFAPARPLCAAPAAPIARAPQPVALSPRTIVGGSGTAVLLGFGFKIRQAQVAEAKRAAAIEFWNSAAGPAGAAREASLR